VASRDSDSDLSGKAFRQNLAFGRANQVIGAACLAAGARIDDYRGRSGILSVNQATLQCLEFSGRFMSSHTQLPFVSEIDPVDVQHVVSTSLAGAYLKHSPAADNHVNHGSAAFSTIVAACEFRVAVGTEEMHDSLFGDIIL